MNDVDIRERETNDQPVSKKLKVEKTETISDKAETKVADGTETKVLDGTEGKTEPSFSFRDFSLIKVLREDARQKLVTLHGSLGTTDVVVLLERKAFDVSTLEQCLRQTDCQVTLQNDIYSTFDVYSGGTFAHMKATVINPATEKHITKYTDREPFVVHETPELYRDVVLPCIEHSKFSFQWVYNILDKTTEAERIVVEDPDPETGFVMVPDLKWDCKNVKALYLIAIVHKRGLKSLRDLTQEHLPLLENILHKGRKAIQDKFSVSHDKLRVYFHYQPSYYHLHVHFTHVTFEAPGTDTLRAHLLEDVIDNIKLSSDFYKNKTLSYVVRQHDPLLHSYVDSKYFS